MANIELGAIITDIQGSVGGSTFRRTPRGLIMYNKQGTQIKSAFAKASRKNQLGVIFSTWQNLSEETKEYWNYQATLYPQKNKFGGDVYLSGRQFFTKLSAQMLATDNNLQVQPLDDRLSQSILIKIDVVLGANIINFRFEPVIENFFVLIAVYPLRKGSNAKPSAHYKRTYNRLEDGVNDINIFDQFKSQYPLAIAGDKFGANIQFCSLSGFVTSVQTVEFTLRD
jgi:hypothetical protein